MEDRSVMQNGNVSYRARVSARKSDARGKRREEEEKGEKRHSLLGILHNGRDLFPILFFGIFAVDCGEGTFGEFFNL